MATSLFNLIKYSDRYSLSVILFMLFYGNHPLEGAKVLGCPCMTEKHEKEFYGSKALFIYDENDKSNLPVRGVHSNVIKRWPVLPKILKEQFQHEFSQECLKEPQKRLIEQQWQKANSAVARYVGYLSSLYGRNIRRKSKSA